MCDVCGDDENDTPTTDREWKSEPGTEARMREVLKLRDDHILEHGHQVLGIFGDDGERWFYSVGRCVYDKDELLITGPLPPEVATFMINKAARLIDEGEIVLDPIEVVEVEKGVLLEGFPCRIHQVLDPEGAEMHQALNIKPELTAYQIVWPDLQGNWPEEALYDTRFDQPIH